MVVGDNKKGLTYASSGVDIEAGEKAVKLMRNAVISTFRPEVMGDLGGFGGLFAFNSALYKEPVLVAGADGVGTKLKVAFLMDRHDTVGIDVVAMCVNDILVQGAEPLFFLDYLAVGKMEPQKVASVVEGVAEGCRRAGCALLGGETAEMPGFYSSGEYDLAGFAVGVVEKGNIIDGKEIAAGDRVIGLVSSGLHSNGYSLARRVLLEDAGYKVTTYHGCLGRTIGEELLEPTRIYTRTVLTLIEKFNIKGLAHITGGGITENIPRILPPGTGVLIKRGSWPVPPVFSMIQEIGRVSEEEMMRTFNMGIGMILVVSDKETDFVLRTITAGGEKAWVVGEVCEGDGRVSYI